MIKDKLWIVALILAATPILVTQLIEDRVMVSIINLVFAISSLVVAEMARRINHKKIMAVAEVYSALVAISSITVVFIQIFK
ncbi:MAG: hypothetical protein PHY26_03925 [Bacilli bacterium]|nr:hypothetical protein [Bacilli bacterium]